MKKEEVTYRGDNKITPITAKILLQEISKFNEWYVLLMNNQHLNNIDSRTSNHNTTNTSKSNIK